MNANGIPERGIDFDDFIGTSYFEKALKIQTPQMVPVFCGKNSKHDDDYIGIRLSGYEATDRGYMQASRMIHPAKEFTSEDLERLFNKVETKDGEVHYTPKSSISFDEVYIRVCYKTPGKPDPKVDNIKWVAAVDGGEAIILHGERRKYNPKDAKDAEE